MSFEILSAFAVFGVLFAIAFIGFTVSMRASARNHSSTRGHAMNNPADVPRDTQRIVR